MNCVQPHLVRKMTKQAAAFRKVTHCIFDMDGLLLDTENIYEGVVRQIAKQFGKPYPLETRLKIMGTVDKRSAEIAVEDLQLPITVDEYLSRYHKMCFQAFNNVPLMKGAQRLLEHLHEHKVPIALATSSSEPAMKLKIANHGALFDLFQHKVCGSTDPDVKLGKPNPDIFLVAASRFPNPPDPAQCLVFEDAPNGVQAATSAGMQVVMVPDPRVSAELRSLATLVLNSLDDFQPELFGLPSFKN